jgi:hypothetical protein
MINALFLSQALKEGTKFKGFNLGSNETLRPLRSAT